MVQKPLLAVDIRSLVTSDASVQVLDVRGSSAFRRSDERVESDLRVMAKEVGSLIDDLDPEAWILAYCTCLGDGLAIRAAERLQALGFDRARAVDDGLEGCRRAGLPVIRKE